ncbi:MAG: hypothetical protein QM771_03595 [Nitrospira sp.]
MIPSCAAFRLRILCMLILAVLLMTPDDLHAIQIAPNPNPNGNTITITPSATGENLVPFTNLGVINIEPFASFQNSKQFDNGSLLPFTPGGAVTNSGNIINSDHFNNYTVVSILEGSRFINLPSGVYLDFSFTTGTLISGTFLNEGRVEGSNSLVAINETGQYIQRQSASSSVTPTTEYGAIGLAMQDGCTSPQVNSQMDSLGVMLKQAQLRLMRCSEPSHT